jgi:hypothetical protein
MKEFAVTITRAGICSMMIKAAAFLVFLAVMFALGKCWTCAVLAICVAIAGMVWDRKVHASWLSPGRR